MQKFQGNRSAASRVRQAMPEALPFGGALIVAANLIVTIWHVYVLGKLQPEMTATQLTLFAAVINVSRSARRLCSGARGAAPRH